MDTPLPQEWTALCAFVFLLGLRHGFDADHLATIDGLTRFNAPTRPRLAQACGALFSLGHGVVVIAVALGMSFVTSHTAIPPWLDVFGTVVSVLFLLALGSVNLAAVLATPAGELVRPVGFKGRLLGRLQRSSHPMVIALVGALFAISFDTLSQAVLFSIAAIHYGGWGHALVLGHLFLLGMLTTDSINSLWIAHLLKRADATARRASRLMGLAVAGVSFAVAGIAFARWVSPTLAQWQNDGALTTSMMLIAVIAVCFVLATRLRPAAR